MTDSPRTSYKKSLGHLLGSVSRLVGSRMRMMLQDIGLNHAQAMVLFHLWREDGMAQNILAQALHIAPATATSTLQRMERDGWVRRRRDPADQRVVRVHLSAKARALHEKVRDTFRELDRELAEVLSDNERRVLMASLIKVHSHLLQAAGEPERPWSGLTGAADTRKAVR